MKNKLNIDMTYLSKRSIYEVRPLELALIGKGVEKISLNDVTAELAKLEEDGYIIREVNPENRRKYMLKTTEKADALVPKIRQISLDWEEQVGISEEDIELKEKIRQIAINGMKLID